MGRIRQYLTGSYASASAVSAEFENIIRYLNSAEYGNKSLSELLSQLFDDNGEVDLGFELGFDGAEGLRYRFANSDDPDWRLAASAEDVRGSPGLNVGSIESPLLFNRQDFIATAGQSVFPYNIAPESVDVWVYRNGVLLSASQYSYSVGGTSVTLSTGATAGDRIVIVSVRNNSAASYRREDITASAGQVLFPFPHEENDDVVVYRNGLLLREGSSFDYIKSWQTGTITVTTPATGGTVLTGIVVNNRALRTVVGLMLEDEYTDAAGFIRLEKINIPNGGLPQAKVSGLVNDLASKARTTVGSSPPASPAPGDFWINTARTVPSLYFWDGSRWLDSSPSGLLPFPSPSNALQWVRLNTAGNAFEFADIDLSAYVDWSAVGAPNGVAPLDNAGRISTTLLPSVASRYELSSAVRGSIANGVIPVGIINRNHSYDLISLQLGAGTATVQVSVGGVAVGGPIAVTSAPLNTAVNVQRDASGTPMPVTLTVSGAAGASDLYYSIRSTYIN